MAVYCNCKFLERRLGLSKCTPIDRVRFLLNFVSLELEISGNPRMLTSSILPRRLFLPSQSASQIIEILGLEVTPSWIQYRISSVEPAFTVSRILKNVTLVMDSAATWKFCSEELVCLGYGSPLLNVSVC